MNFMSSVCYVNSDKLGIDPWLLTKSRECPICKRNVTLSQEPEEPTEETALLITTD